MEQKEKIFALRQPLPTIPAGTRGKWEPGYNSFFSETVCDIGFNFSIESMEKIPEFFQEVELKLELKLPPIPENPIIPEITIDQLIAIANLGGHHISDPIRLLAIDCLTRLVNKQCTRLGVTTTEESIYVRLGGMGFDVTKRPKKEFSVQGFGVGDVGEHSRCDGRHDFKIPINPEIPLIPEDWKSFTEIPTKSGFYTCITLKGKTITDVWRSFPGEVGSGWAWNRDINRANDMDYIACYNPNSFREPPKS